MSERITCPRCRKRRKGFPGSLCFQCEAKVLEDEMPEHKYDFERIKTEVTVPMVLARQNVALKAEGDRYRAACPITPCKSKTGYVAWPKGFKCHSCGRKGNVIDLVCDLSGLPRDGKGPVEAAKLIYDWFGMNGERKGIAENLNNRPPDVNVPESEPAVNEPLKFVLKDVTPDHPYLRARGFLPEHAEAIGAGFFPGKGSMAGRFVFPVHRADGVLVAYAGRLMDIAVMPVDNAVISDEKPRWLFGKFKKSLELHNLHRVTGDTVVIVESFWGVLGCIRAGIPNVVSTMGHDLSDAQAALLDRFRHVVLLYDGDEPGRTGSEQAGAKLLARRFDSVKVVFLPNGQQPDTVPVEDLPGWIF